MPFDRKTIRRRRNLLLTLVAVALSLGLLAYAVNWWLYGRFWVVTDNAFVTGNLIPVHADATGVVVEVLSEETQYVKRGDCLSVLMASALRQLSVRRRANWGAPCARSARFSQPASRCVKKFSLAWPQSAEARVGGTTRITRSSR
jgi:membrane fusion protein, multidrug efflux system